MSARITVRVQPKASRNEVADWQQGMPRIRLTAPPVDGAANKALVEFMADVLRVRRANITLVAGHKGRTKTLEVDGLTENELRERLMPSP